MVVTEKIESGEVIFTGKKKYKRVFLKNGVEWRRFKTNHQVTKEQHEILEEKYRMLFPNTQPYLVPAGVKKFNIQIDSDRVMLENNLLAASDNGKAKLSGVKRVKEITGWGLKDSRDYVVEFFDRKTKYNKATSSTKKEEAGKRLVEFMKTNDSKLVCVKYVKEITGWSLMDSKDFTVAFFQRRDAVNKLREIGIITK